MNCNINNLLRQTMHMLKGSTETLEDISAGAGVNYHWLAKLSQGRIPEPGIGKVSRLYNYLNRRAA